MKTLMQIYLFSRKPKRVTYQLHTIMKQSPHVYELHTIMKQSPHVYQEQIQQQNKQRTIIAKLKSQIRGSVDSGDTSPVFSEVYWWCPGDSNDWNLKFYPDINTINISI